MNTVLQLEPRERQELFAAASQQLGISANIIEKDFWVCWTLRELFAVPSLGEHMVFKGGTSLSKVWKAIHRFSEDIDVSLSREWLGFGGELDPERASSKSQRQKRLEELVAACSVKIGKELLPTLRDRFAAVLGPTGWMLEVDPAEKTGQTLLFHVPSATTGAPSPHYFRREVKIEFGARADLWPMENKVLRAYVAEAFPKRLVNDEVHVKVLAIERTFWEKATILHADVHQKTGKAPRPRYSRHYADLAVLADHEAGRRALMRDDLRERVVAHKQVFFSDKWASYETAIPGSFCLLPGVGRLRELERDFRDMQEMFFGEPPVWPDIVARLHQLEDEINHLPRAKTNRNNPGC